MPEVLYKGYLKDYEGSTLMECLIVDGVDYHQIMNRIRHQRALVTEMIK